MCTPTTYSDVDRAKFEGWKANATQKGVQLEGEHSGKLQWAAVKGTFSWNESAAALTVELTIASTEKNCRVMYGDLHKMIPAEAAPAIATPPGPALAIDDSGRYTVIGRILRTGTPLGDVRVQAWDADKIGADDKLGQAQTDAQGFFTIGFNPEDFNDWGTETHPDLYFKIFSGDNMIGESSGNTIYDAQPGIDDIVIDLPASSANNEA
ncbi:MAG: hypothetical protein AAGN35_24990 [Bacteroidota bacterium]